MLNTTHSRAAVLLRTSRLTALALLSLAIARPALAQTYNVTDLGKDFMPRAVNDLGQVVGENATGLVLWSSGRTVLLKSSAGYKKGSSINASGQVVGTYDTGVIGANGYSIIHAFLWNPTVANGDTGTFIDLNDTLAAGSGWSLDFGHDINDAGQVVGYGTYTNGTTTSSGIDFLWETDAAGYGKVTSVPMGPSDNDNPSALNNLAPPQVAGTVNTESFVWQASTPMIALGHLDAAQTQAWDINDAGQIVGISNNKAFLWTPGGTNGVASNPQMRNLQPATGVSSSKSFSINNAGLVVGIATTTTTTTTRPITTTSSYLAFSWDSANGWRDLNKFSTKPTGSQLKAARGCNNRTVNGVPSAQIVINGSLAVTTTVRNKKTTVNENHGFLLTPQ